MDLSHDELVWIGNALNEVLHGPDALDDAELPTRLGGTPDEVRRLLQRVKQERDRQR